MEKSAVVVGVIVVLAIVAIAFITGSVRDPPLKSKARGAGPPCSNSFPSTGTCPPGFELLESFNPPRTECVCFGPNYANVGPNGCECSQRRTCEQRFLAGGACPPGLRRDVKYDPVDGYPIESWCVCDSPNFANFGPSGCLCSRKRW